MTAMFIGTICLGLIILTSAFIISDTRWNNAELQHQLERMEEQLQWERETNESLAKQAADTATERNRLRAELERRGNRDQTNHPSLRVVK